MFGFVGRLKKEYTFAASKQPCSDSMAGLMYNFVSLFTQAGIKANNYLSERNQKFSYDTDKINFRDSWNHWRQTG